MLKIDFKAWEILARLHLPSFCNSLCFLVGMILTVNAASKNLGVIGEIWPIQEHSMLKLLEKRSITLNTQEIHEKWTSRARNYSDRPKALLLPRIQRTSHHTYTPIVNLNQDIKDNEGQVIAFAGTSVNVFAHLTDYAPQWLFFNADDKSQLSWAIKQSLKISSQAKFILTGGSIVNAEKLLKKQVYFDQSGAISKKLSIKHVPASAHREGLSLMIDELAIKESGDER